MWQSLETVSACQMNDAPDLTDVRSMAVSNLNTIVGGSFHEENFERLSVRRVL